MTSPVAASLAALRAHGVDGPLDAAIVLGTGLSGLAESLSEAVAISYANLPGFPKPGVSGHAGRLVVGRSHGRRIAFLQGRAHYYESGDPRVMAGALECLTALGCGALVLTAASGSLRADLPPGGLMLITDHINWSGLNPLIGVRTDDRFVSMVDAYDPALRARFLTAAARSGVALPEGVYMWFSGPSFETPAEIRMAGLMGADAVGMSVAPEVILARRLGLRVGAVTLITNYGAGYQGGAPTHDQTKSIAAIGAQSLATLLDSFIEGIGTS